MRPLYFLLLCLCGDVGCQTDPLLTPEQNQAADHARQAASEQKHQAEDLRNRYKRYSTAELLIMRARYLDLTERTATKDGVPQPLATKVTGTADRENTEKVIGI